MTDARLCGISLSVRSLRILLTFLLAVVWIPLTAHCQIESLTGLEVLRCAGAEAGGTSGDSHCDSGSCCSWESGDYRLPERQAPVAAPTPAMIPEITAAVTEELSPSGIAGFRAVAVPEPPRPWQFSLRTALPPRAPSPVA